MTLSAFVWISYSFVKSFGAYFDLENRSMDKLFVILSIYGTGCIPGALLLNFGYLKTFLVLNTFFTFLRIFLFTVNFFVLKEGSQKRKDNTTNFGIEIVRFITVLVCWTIS